MKKFLAVYLGTAAKRARWDALSEAERTKRERAGMEAWGGWMTKHRDIIVDRGGPLGRTKRADEQGVSDVKNAMAGYVILEAESHEAAARLFEQHPHFSIFPGDSVEIMECLPIPGE